jgi:hypothetical protein
MPAEALKLGPFVGGLNTASDPTIIDDNELTESLNMELDLDGSLTNRPPISVVEEGATDSRLLIFGTATFSGTVYLFASQPGKTFVSDDLGVTWDELLPASTARECISMVVYQDTVWLPSITPGLEGIAWTPSSVVEVAAMPNGSACVVHKNRLYICPGSIGVANESRLHFSDAADFTTWPGTNFIDVNDGDGTTLNNLIVYQDNLLLFKSESTFVLAYDLNPTDAVLREINTVVGSRDSFGVVQYENTVYCMHHSKVYEIVNFNFQIINLKIPFELDSSMPTGTTTRHEDQHISLLGDRLVVRFFNRTYVYGLRTKTWSEWRKTDILEDVEWHIFGPLVKVIHDDSGLALDFYYTGYSFSVSAGLGYKQIRIPDKSTDDDVEGFGTSTMHCIATTKTYDMADPIRYKRLFWWGADVVTGNDIVGSVQPITIQFSPSWLSLGDLTWNDLNTWEIPLLGAVSTPTSIEADTIFNTNKFVKFLKSLRFRKVNFSIMMETDGSNLQPTKLLSFVALIKTKQLVSAGTS